MPYPNTGAPEWAASQASPWTSVNEAGFIFDAFAARSIIEDRDLTAPPGSCANGARYLVDATATGLWAGHDGELAIAIGANASNGWYFATVAHHGVQLFVRDEDLLIEYDGAAWVTAPGGVSVLNDLTDVDAPAPGNGDSLRFNSGSGEWEAVADGFTLDTDATLAANSDTRVASQKATKTYVDNKVAGVSWKQAVRVATTVNGTLASAFENGDAIDGVTLATGDRILIKDQSSGSENGIYVVAASGAPTRATDADSGAEMINATVYVSEGGTNADKQFTCTTNAPITVGSTVLTFVQLSTGTSVSDFTDLADVPSSYSGQSGRVAAVNATEDGLEFIPAASVTASADAVIDAQFFGDGSDGDATISSGTTVLTRDMHYNNLTISGTGSIDPRGFRIFVKGTLDISAAPAHAIYIDVAAGSRNGTNAVQFAGGAGGANSINSNATLGNATFVASSGSSGGTGAGSQAGSPGTPLSAMGQQAGSGGAGGAVGATNGGASRASIAPTQARDLRRLNAELAVFSGSSFGKIDSGASGPGGSAGAGDGVGNGGGGGGGGTGGGIVFVAARTINRGGSTAAGAISAVGGNGGNGASGNGGTNRGGGGGGAGGSGGWIYLIYRSLTGSTATGCLDASGGNGGSGGNGVGTGGGGNGGGAGGTGRIDIYNLGAGTQTITAMSGPLAGNAASGGTGGAAKTATAQTASL